MVLHPKYQEDSSESFSFFRMWLAHYYIHSRQPVATTNIAGGANKQGNARLMWASMHSFHAKASYYMGTLFLGCRWCGYGRLACIVFMPSASSSSSSLIRSQEMFQLLFVKF